MCSCWKFQTSYMHQNRQGILKLKLQRNRNIFNEKQQQWINRKLTFREYLIACQGGSLQPSVAHSALFCCRPYTQYGPAKARNKKENQISRKNQNIVGRKEEEQSLQCLRQRWQGPKIVVAEQELRKWWLNSKQEPWGSESKNEIMKIALFEW